MDSASTHTPLGRRGLLAGAGLAALAAGAAVTGTAEAKPTGTGSKGLEVTRRASAKLAAKAAGASTPVSGYTYRSVWAYDFQPLDPRAGREADEYGVYSTDFLVSSLEIPPGARLREVEMYVYNNTGAGIIFGAYLFLPGGQGVFPLEIMAVPSGTDVSTTRMTFAAELQGPYGVGTILALQVPATDTTGLVQVAGARIGFTQGAAETGLLPTPSRVYDSRSGSGDKFGAGTTRTITIPAEFVVPGTTGLLVNVASVGATGKGFLKVWSADASQPSASALNYNAAGDSIANAITVGVSASRQIKVYASQPTHVVVDLTGTVA